MSITFAHLGLPETLTRALAAAGIDEPFPIQHTAIPDVLAGRDVAGKAPTGSGKTLAFGLPLLARVDRAQSRRPRALILSPTRELAEQIKQELSPLAGRVGRSVYAIYGGVSYGPQKNALRRGVDVLVATPGRLEDLIEQRSVELDAVEIAVVDEADRMADMGFLPAVRRILDKTAKNRQTLLFSATLDGDVSVLSRAYQRDPVRHEAGSVASDTIEADHRFWLVGHNDRVERTAQAIGAHGQSIVFTRTRHGADRLAKQLGKQGVEAIALHGGRSQAQRSSALARFAAGRVRALVATDVAARGIHVDGVGAVVHFDLPSDSKDYVHRSGRTARAGATGTIISMVTGDKKRAARRIQQDLGLDSRFEDPSRPGEDAVPGSADERRPGSPDAESLYVANLPWTTTDGDLADLFAPFGTVHQTTIIFDRKTGRSRGFGFVDMPESDARTAIDALHGTTVAGREMTVRLAKPRRWGG